MPEPTVCTLGWQLDHAAIEALDLSETARIAHCDALFLAVGSVSELWQHAVGHPVRSFRSSAHEQQCWQGLAALNQQLRRLIRRGGVVLVRLDCPEDKCRITCRPDDPRLPVGSPVDVYDALSSADPLLAAVARGRRLFSDPPLGPLTTTTAEDVRQTFLPYLQQASHHAFASLSLADIEGLAQPLLTTAAGDCVAAASGQVVLLPPLGMLDSRQEASCLLATLDRLMAARRPQHWTPIIEPPHGQESVLAIPADRHPGNEGGHLADWALTADERAVLSAS